MENKIATSPNCEFISIKKDSLSKLIKNNYRLSHMVLVLEYVCKIKHIKVTLTAEEICEVLQIKPQEFARCKDRNWITPVATVEGICLYKAFDIVLLAERIKRRSVLHQLNKLPTINT